MIIDAAQRHYPKEDDKIIWLLAVILGGIVGAITYYFVVKSKA